MTLRRVVLALLLLTAAAFAYTHDWRGDGGVEADATAGFRWHGQREIAVIDGARVLISGFDRKGPVHPARLWGITAPRAEEMCQPNARAQSWPCGAFARDTLAAILVEGSATCFATGPQPMQGEPELVWCRVGDLSISSLMVMAGAARATPGEVAALTMLEQRAKEAGLGLWAHSAVRGVARVIDGDTVDIAGTRVRMKGIAAPERNEPGGSEATAALKAMIGDGAVSCALTGEKTREREVGYCYDAKGVDLNFKMVAGGWALACPRFGARYIDAELLTGPARQAGYERPGYCSTNR